MNSLGPVAQFQFFLLLPFMDYKYTQIVCYMKHGQVLTSSPVGRQQFAATHGGGNSNNNINVPLANSRNVSAAADAALPTDFPTALSRSFTFESAGGVRRKIPVTPVVSTAGSVKRFPSHPAATGSMMTNVMSQSGSNARHDTLHYRYLTNS